MATALSDIKAAIKERTVELSNEEYMEFLRTLAMWAEDEANMMEYLPEFNTDEE